MPVGGTTRSLPHCFRMGIPPHDRRSFLLISLLLCTQISSATITIEFDGIKDELEAAARNNLEMQQYVERSLSASQANRLFAKAAEEIREALQPYGYYHAQVSGDLQNGEKDGDFRAVFRVTPGEPVLVGHADVAVDGTAAELAPIKAALEAFRPKVGEPLEHGVYEGSKSNITSQLQGNGYFDAQLERHRVEVLQSAKSADIDLKWLAGERYRFGDVNFSDVQFPEDFLRRYVPWDPDAYYTVDEMLTLQQRLVDADYFSTVSVQPDLERKANGRVPVEATLIPAKRTIYTAGAYVSTDTGPGGRVGMERRWLNRRGHKVGGELEYSTRLEEYSAFYRIPRPGRRNRNYNFGIGYRDEETDSSTSRLARLGASEVLDQWHGFTRTLGLQYLNGDFEIAEEQRSSSLLYADGMLTRRRADDVMFPSRGISLLYGVRFAHEGVLSDTSLAQIRAEAKWIRPASRQSRLILRAAVGAMVVDDFDALPPELRFFAGGDRSVRGFDYQQIGEVNQTGGVIGGKYLTVGSVEYEYYFLPTWGAAVFVDGGDAYSSTFNPNVGAGIGLRWRSPVGVVRVDVGMPVVTDLEDGIRFHIVIGPDL
jgi:translocation and assembly module TamA